MQRQKKFKIGKKEFIAEFPNVGQIIDMESLKQSLSNNRYGVMAASGIASMYFALDVVDAISFYKSCTPEVAKYFNIKSYTSMKPNDIKELVEVYKAEIKPWYDRCFMEIQGITENGQGED